MFIRFGRCSSAFPYRGFLNCWSRNLCSYCDICCMKGCRRLIVVGIDQNNPASLLARFDRYLTSPPAPSSSSTCKACKGTGRARTNRTEHLSASIHWFQTLDTIIAPATQLSSVTSIRNALINWGSLHLLARPFVHSTSHLDVEIVPPRHVTEMILTVP